MIWFTTGSSAGQRWRRPRTGAATCRSIDGIDRGLRTLDPGRAEVLVEDGLPDVRPVGEHRVDELLHRGVVLGEADAVALLTEGLADDLERVRVLRGEADQDGLVGRDSVDLPVLELLDALRVGVELRGRGIRILVLDPL